MKSKWDKNSIQFPRLIVELDMAGAITEEVMNRLCDSMDLERSDILELLGRAQKKHHKDKEASWNARTMSNLEDENQTRPKPFSMKASLVQTVLRGHIAVEESLSSFERVYLGQYPEAWRVMMKNSEGEPEKYLFKDDESCDAFVEDICNSEEEISPMTLTKLKAMV